MTKVAGVKFKRAGRMYYFDPQELDPEVGSGVIVETARGMEYGTVSMAVSEVRDEDIRKPLKRIVRIADEDDIRRHEENEQKKSRAMKICREKIEKHGLDMRLIDVEYTFDNNKIIFYFTADGRVDFRGLVKDLASVFKMRIELRQVGVRDEAKMIGGIGFCGRGLCCATWLTDFQPVSIKMAKTQNLSLNPTKISGVCGRLMCCLKFENDVYQELRKGLPNTNARVETPDGTGKVIDTDVLTGKVRVRLFSGEKDEYGNDKLEPDIHVYQKEDLAEQGKPAKGGSGRGSHHHREQGEETEERSRHHAERKAGERREDVDAAPEPGTEESEGNRKANGERKSNSERKPNGERRNPPGEKADGKADGKNEKRRGGRHRSGRSRRRRSGKRPEKQQNEPAN
jgi:cell fate regulator YaaT (PSP1 superfamily)